MIKGIFSFRVLWILLLIFTGGLSLSTGVVHAYLSAQAIYSEFGISGGLWRYDYRIANTSDPVADAGFYLYDFFLYVTPTAAITNILSPSGWEFSSDSATFIAWYSIFPGAPPIGADIAPGSSLGGFSFTSDVRLGSLSFDVLLTNPNEPFDPVPLSGNSSPVPVPSAILLLGSGLLGLIGLRKKFKKLT